tara:strand:- start:982 stop:2007 length:1026 start_codon:yes stop_codon:yes gene_type:complete
MQNIKRENVSIILWLFSGCFLIFTMVIVGGITRLTGSGLSMVDWNLFMGVVPPLNYQEWMEAFNQYKEYPEYQERNYMFSLTDFKKIFFWEYIHRVLGRFIGLVFIIPYLYFIIRKRFTKKLLFQTSVLLILGSLQGFFGWWMVKSGLVDRPDVSHLRLATHLITAFLTFSFTFWITLSLVYPQKKHSNKTLYKSTLLLFFVVITQIIYGAFVSGLDAGQIYNTWPKMYEKWIAESVYAMKPLWQNFIYGMSGVQFIHRYLAVAIFLIVAYMYIKSKKLELLSIQTTAINLLSIIVFLQIVLGIFTLTYGVPIWLGVIHQLGAFILLANTVFCLFIFKKTT